MRRYAHEPIRFHPDIAEPHPSEDANDLPGDHTLDGYEIVSVATVIDVRTPDGKIISIWHTQELPHADNSNFALDFVRQSSKVRA